MRNVSTSTLHPPPPDPTRPLPHPPRSPRAHGLLRMPWNAGDDLLCGSDSVGGHDGRHGEQGRRRDPPVPAEQLPMLRVLTLSRPPRKRPCKKRQLRQGVFRGKYRKLPSAVQCITVVQESGRTTDEDTAPRRIALTAKASFLFVFSPCLRRPTCKPSIPKPRFPVYQFTQQY